MLPWEPCRCSERGLYCCTFCLTVNLDSKSMHVLKQTANYAQHCKINLPRLLLSYANCFLSHMSSLDILECGLGLTDVESSRALMCMTAPLRLLIASHCASLCRASELICSLTYAATVSWSIWTADHAHFRIP